MTPFPNGPPTGDLVLALLTARSAWPGFPPDLVASEVYRERGDAWVRRQIGAAAGVEASLVRLTLNRYAKALG